MRAERSDLWQLAVRIRNGDTTASAAFLHELERQIVRIVRRHARSGRTISEVDRRIALAVGRLFEGDSHPASPNRTVLIEEATHWICRAALEAIRSDHRALETVFDC